MVRQRQCVRAAPMRLWGGRSSFRAKPWAGRVGINHGAGAYGLVAIVHLRRTVGRRTPCGCSPTHPARRADGDIELSQPSMGRASEGQAVLPRKDLCREVPTNPLNPICPRTPLRVAEWDMTGIRATKCSVSQVPAISHPPAHKGFRETPLGPRQGLRSLEPWVCRGRSPSRSLGCPQLHSAGGRVGQEPTRRGREGGTRAYAKLGDGALSTYIRTVVNPTPKGRVT